MTEAELGSEIARALRAWDSCGFSGLCERDKLLVAIGALEAEVNNGGLDQYYFNNAGDLWKAAVAALRTVGAVRMAELVERSSSRFGVDGPSTKCEQRRVELLKLTQSERENAFAELDREFWSYPDDVSALLRGYLVNRRPGARRDDA